MKRKILQIWIKNGQIIAVEQLASNQMDIVNSVDEKSR